MRLKPEEQGELPGLGLGIPNIVDRATARANELSRDEYVTGGTAFTAKVPHWQPGWLAVVGIGAYRTAFPTGRPPTWAEYSKSRRRARSQSGGPSSSKCRATSKGRRGPVVPGMCRYGNSDELAFVGGSHHQPVE